MGFGGIPLAHLTAAALAALLLKKRWRYTAEALEVHGLKQHQKYSEKSEDEPQAGGGTRVLDTSRAVRDPTKFDPSLRAAREDLAFAYRILYNLGLNTFTYNHLTVDCG
jgi:hypothetical protein